MRWSSGDRRRGWADDLRAWPTVLLALAGCTRSPSQDIAGSFFPAWMLCAVLGCAAAVVVRLALGAVRLDRHVLAPPLAYSAVAVATGTFAWLFRFGQ